MGVGFGCVKQKMESLKCMGVRPLFGVCKGFVVTVSRGCV